MTITQIVNLVYFLTNTDANSFTAANMLLAINNAYERVATLILQSDGRWEWDDLNQTDLPIATTTLTASQADYSIATNHMSINRIEVKDTSGNWYQLTPLSQSDLKGIALTDFLETAAQPTYYDLIGNSIFLYPAPNYTQSASLKVYFQRGPALYTSGEVTTGTKEPGFNSLFHRLIPLWVAYDYAIARGKQNAQQLRQEIAVMEAEVANMYQLRLKDEPLKMRTVYRNPR